MNRDEYYEKEHQKNLKTLRQIWNRIRAGVFKIVSINFDQKLDGTGYRVVIHLRER